MKDKNEKSTKLHRRGKLKTEEGPDPSFKVKVVLDYLEGERDQRSVAAQYELSQTTLCHWIKSYLKNKENFMSKKSKKTLPPSLDHEKELSTLKKQLEEERLKNIALQELINVAEKQFNIPIQKKPGAKQ
jgi:transposase